MGSCCQFVARAFECGFVARINDESPTAAR
jgi:hypothetical protein